MPATSTTCRVACSRIERSPYAIRCLAVIFLGGGSTPLARSDPAHGTSYVPRNLRSPRLSFAEPRSRASRTL